MYQWFSNIFLKEIEEYANNSSVSTLWQVINLMLKDYREFSVLQIAPYHQFHDIDDEIDLMDFKRSKNTKKRKRNLFLKR